MKKAVANCTETAKRRRDLAMAREAGADLSAAVAAWVRALGGVPIRVDDLKAEAYGKCRYRVSLRVRGTWPKAKYELK